MPPRSSAVTILADTQHRTAIIRGTLSRPVRLAVDHGIVSVDDSFFDYGCGRGEDVSRLIAGGIRATGWDPHFHPDSKKVGAHVVNLGYVINVIPSVAERHQTVVEAWKLAERALVVSARLDTELRRLSTGRPHGDGFLTGRGTFQKFYSQAELRTWLDSVLKLETIALAPGVFVAFKNEEDANKFLLRIQHRKRISVRPSRSDQIYDEHREAIDELITFYGERGRLPAGDELPNLQTRLIDAAGSVRRAWQVATRVTADTDWNAVSSERRLDLLAELALLKLNRRPTFTALPETTQLDVRGLVGSYKQATAEADQLLFSAGLKEVVAHAADESLIGKRLPGSLYLHRSAVPQLPQVLRVYEGCARWLVGDIPEANIIKLATNKPKVSYLEYPDFDENPHPALRKTTFVKINTLYVGERNYSRSDNPPILHRKETLVGLDYPLRDKFARFTAQEQRFGLLDGDTRTIGTQRAWLERLHSHGVSLRGHRVVRVTNNRQDQRVR